MYKYCICAVLVLWFAVYLPMRASKAEDTMLRQAEELYNAGSYREAADLLGPRVVGVDKPDAKMLLLYGKCLEGMTEGINTDAERRCYRSPGAPRVPKCMYNYADKLNDKYGAGSFEYVHDIITIKYTGIHFERAKTSGARGDVTAEAAYRELTKGLIGHPSTVLPRVQEFLQGYPKGVWHKRGLLLWARLNEDIWWIHRNWAWLLYNWQMSEDELIIRAESYRQEAIKAFKGVKGGDEGKAAKAELKLLLNYQSDGRLYGIINEADIEGVRTEPGEKQIEK